ncbi:glycosyltransferase family 2 protein [Flavobacterium piscisymbiosum]|uniref:Glycosyltransferase n=1 Tax=Flavobacterium piscisymbiosum TaxID=2893753 RepID=A0ABS8MA29_9FLAO|nr:galactosyltransferase-related protein [Flavobacterium sp. F-30]MCC9061717.1 glycosyltransferase [Flavobacterium sp. F-30]
MITLVLINRNRNFGIIKKCLNSLMLQSNTDFELILVDYGSEEKYVIDLEKLLIEYPKVKFIKCSVHGQLWNKSRAINIALKQAVNPYFLIGDIDMIYHQDFFNYLDKLKSEQKAIYFKVGFLNREESLNEKSFADYKINHLSSIEATGITLYPTSLLKSINGYDEFYHGWGAEDTDVHIRFKNAGYAVEFYEKKTLLLHQWHSKEYRSNKSKAPFHSTLEKINHCYSQLAVEMAKTKANVNLSWGKISNESDCLKLNDSPDFSTTLEPVDAQIKSFIAQFKDCSNKLISVEIKDVSIGDKIKQTLKKILGKKYMIYLNMNDVNDRLLEEIVFNYRAQLYFYSFDRQKNIITWKILF